jgi:hypothetical protein
LLMEYTVMYSFIFALAFFGFPVLVYMMIKKRKGVDLNESDT